MLRTKVGRVPKWNVYQSGLRTKVGRVPKWVAYQSGTCTEVGRVPKWDVCGTQDYQMVDVMVRTCQHVKEINKCVDNYHHSHTNTVLRSYTALVDLAGIVSPEQHVEWLLQLSFYTGGIHVVDKTNFSQVSEDVQFDTRRHMIMTSQASLLSYMVEDTSVLGRGARMKMGDFKRIHLWWEA